MSFFTSVLYHAPRSVVRADASDLRQEVSVLRERLGEAAAAEVVRISQQAETQQLRERTEQWRAAAAEAAAALKGIDEPPPAAGGSPVGGAGAGAGPRSPPAGSPRLSALARGLETSPQELMVLAREAGRSLSATREELSRAKAAAGEFRRAAEELQVILEQSRAELEAVQGTCADLSEAKLLLMEQAAIAEARAAEAAADEEQGRKEHTAEVLALRRQIEGLQAQLEDVRAVRVGRAERCKCDQAFALLFLCFPLLHSV